MLETSILLHTAYCLKINERNYTIPHSILLFHPEHNEMCREIPTALEGFLIQGVVWHSCTASWDRQDRPSSPGISGAPRGMNSTAASEARPRPHRWSPSAESWRPQEKAPSHSCGLFHQEAHTEVSSKLLRDLCMAVHSSLFLKCSNCKARVYEVQWLSSWRKSSVTLGYCGLRMWSFVSL